MIELYKDSNQVEAQETRVACKSFNCNKDVSKGREYCNVCIEEYVSEPNYQKWFKDLPVFPKPDVYIKPNIDVEINKTEIGKKTGSLAKDELTEYIDKPEVIKEKAKIVAKLIKESKYACAYTGAGVSTSSSIPDFRGPKGIWTLRSLGENVERKISAITTALPNICHYSLVKLNEDGFLKSVISTNTDGLHRRSGLPTEDLYELHGNTYLERCQRCGNECLRNFSTRFKKKGTHLNGRKCEIKGCGGPMMDSIIAFGENLPEKELKGARNRSKLCDLALVLGTSMRVNPACSLPEYIWRDKNKAPGKLVIVNLQDTPYDRECYLRVYSKMDDFIELVMKELYPDVDMKKLTVELNEKIERTFEFEEESKNKQQKDEEEKPKMIEYKKLN